METKTKIEGLVDHYDLMDPKGVFFPRGVQIRLTVVSTDELSTLRFNKPYVAKYFYYRALKLAISQRKDTNNYTYLDDLKMIQVKHPGMDREQVREFYKDNMRQLGQNSRGKR